MATEACRRETMNHLPPFTIYNLSFSNFNFLAAVGRLFPFVAKAIYHSARPRFRKFSEGRGEIGVKDVLTLILAGGKGTRLDPLTRDRAKPAVPFGGLYRIIDFTLSNCVNSDLRRILVLTQYKARSLDRHIAAGWGFFSRELDEYVEILPPQQRIDEHWYKGTADAIYQNIYTIEKADPQYVLILAGDHIYKMDYGDMIRAHLDHGADLTIGCISVPLREGSHFGIMRVDEKERVTGFLEKPQQPPGMPGQPNQCLA